jgi:1-deoxy-D-xylulose-5-phosphate synthase
MNLPVAFAIDRAGIVGEDGETHQGAFDVSYLRTVPNITLFAPRDEASMIEAMKFAKEFPTPCAFRYPRGAFGSLDASFETQAFKLGVSQLLKEAQSDTLFIGYGTGVFKAYETMKLLDHDIALLDLRFVKPLDEAMLTKLTSRYTRWFVFSDSAKIGGVASAVGEFLFANKLNHIELSSFEYDDAFITHGKTALVEESLGLSAQKIATYLQKRL